MGLNNDKTFKVFCINMIYRSAPLFEWPWTTHDPYFKVTELLHYYALYVLCAPQLTRGLFAIAYFLVPCSFTHAVDCMSVCQCECFRTKWTKSSGRRLTATRHT